MAQLFTPKQQEAFELICSGHNVFITGQAGTGLSLIMFSLKTILIEESSDPSVAWKSANGPSKFK